jgi:hypothetical protein
VSIQTVWQKLFSFFPGKPVVVEPQPTQATSDAGLLPIREFDERIGFTQQFAAAISDPREPSAVVHPVLDMVRMRVYGILADYPDQDDHDLLRSDPVFKLITGHSIRDGDLASQPTLSRFENFIDIPSLWRLRDVLIDQFLASFSEPPRRITLDIDVFDDPTHGQQQLTFFHGYYDQYQYLPRVITCAENDLVVALTLLFGIASPVLGADEQLAYVVKRLRAAWPDVRIIVRGDSGFAVPLFYAACEQLGVEYTFGLRTNQVLQRLSDALLAEAVAEYERSGLPQRRFTGFEYQAESWPEPRWVVAKAEANAQGTNRRFVVTNRPGARVVPQAGYDDYAERGESENRNKELKCGLQADRLSDHRFLANLFRLYLHSAAHNLLARLRSVVAQPAPESPGREVPIEAQTEAQRRRYFNERRKRDPLGEGQPCTWRTRLIKVAAYVTESARRIVVRLPSHWPYLNHYVSVSDAVLNLPRAEPRALGPHLRPP